MEDPSLCVLHAAHELLVATGHGDSSLARVMRDAPLVVVETAAAPDFPAAWPLPPPPPHKNGPIETGPACVLCEHPTKGVGDDAFEFVATHNESIKFVACARCIFSSMWMLTHKQDTPARAVAYIYHQ